jgi:hypothetical protein
MTQFQLFDSIQLKEPIALEPNLIAPEGTPGEIVEIFNNGEAYMVELFGGWVKAAIGQDFVAADRIDPQAFMETIGVETVYPHQMDLVEAAHKPVNVREQLLLLMDELPEAQLVVVRDFAETLKAK